MSNSAQAQLSRPKLDESENIALLSDQALADRIRFFDMQMQAAMTLGMRDEAHRNRQHFEAALRERNSRPHLVAAREALLGIGPRAGNE